MLDEANAKIMESAARNLTNERSKVLAYIDKETNMVRRAQLQKIFVTTELIRERFEGCKASAVYGTQEYRDLCRPAFEIISKQRHAGRKIFLMSVTNPVLGLDTVHYFWWCTTRGVSGSQLQNMSPFLAEMKGIKVEPKIGLKSKTMYKYFLTNS